MQSIRFERNPQLGLIETTAHGDIVCYPLGAMFPGVRMTHDALYGGRWRRLLAGGVAAVLWGVLLTLVFPRPRIGTAELAFEILSLNGCWFLALGLISPLLFAPRRLRVSRTPWARQRTGEVVLPLHHGMSFWVVGLLAAGSVVLAYTAPGPASDPKHVALVAFLLECAAVFFGYAVYCGYCNWRINQAGARRFGPQVSA